MRYLKRCLQALPTSPPTTPPPLFCGFSTARPHFSLVCTDREPCTGYRGQSNKAALLLKLKYPKSLTAFCVYHNQLSCCISYSNLNSQRVFFNFATNTGLIFSPNKNHKYNLPAIISPVNTLISVILSRVINYVVVVVFFSLKRYKTVLPSVTKWRLKFIRRSTLTISGFVT